MQDKKAALIFAIIALVVALFLAMHRISLLKEPLKYRVFSGFQRLAMLEQALADRAQVHLMLNLKQLKIN